MVTAFLTLVGLCMGSFVNALVWRLHEQSMQARKKNPDKDYQKRLSISKGASMCPHCKHKLSAADLIPVLSWLALGGKCRYCHKPISVQYPLVELMGAALFAASYIWWPADLRSYEIGIFVWWLILLVGLMALIVYDLRWLLLPNRIMYPAVVAALVMAIISIINAGSPLKALLSTVLGIVIGGGIFYILFQISKGKWIGGGDVKLGGLLGLAVGTPGGAVLFIFVAAVLGTVVSLPMLASGKMKRTSVIPFGPFLIIGAVVAKLFGADILHWYQQTFINF
ncbi:MAG TPA: prepilin peptidase [Candidatus Saccharimonadales bacterium]|nr:prepilin peptidase [Candidatus Saccharimonadales bacterium]